MVVRLEDEEKNDVGKMCVEVGVGVVVEKAIETKDNKVPPTEAQQKKKLAKFPRTTLPLNTATEVVVSHVENPSRMYLSPVNMVDTFNKSNSQK